MLSAESVPILRAGTGPRHAVVFFGVNALFKPLDRTRDPARYVAQVSRLLPGYRITILGYNGGRGGFDAIVSDMARAITAALDLLVGISFGGFVAIRFAARYPELVPRLALLVSAHRFSASGWRMIHRQFDAPQQDDLPTLVRENALLFRRPWYNWLVRLKLWKDRRTLTDEFRQASEILADYRTLFNSSFEEENARCARRVTCPALVVGGSADPLFDAACLTETASLIPHARLRVFDNETHTLPIERSSAVARTLADFLKSA